MRDISRYIGLIAILLALVGAAAYVLVPEHLAAYLIPWVLAAAGVVVYIVYNVKEIRDFIFSRQTRYGAGSILSVILVLGIIVIICVLTVRHSARWDLTQNKRFSLAPQTIKVLKNLTEPVKASAFFQENSPGQGRVKNIFEQYAHASAKFKYEMVDPDREPARVKAAKVTRNGTIVVEAAGRNEQIFNLNEEQLTNAIIRLVRTDKKRIYFLAGHGEKDIEEMGREGYSTVVKTLEDQNYELKKFSLMQVEDAPLDAVVLVVSGPQKDFFPNELAAIERYLKRGGNVIFMIDPQTCPELVKFMTRFKVKLGDDIIIDQLSRIYGADYTMPVILQYASHPVTKNFTLASFFPLARSVSVIEEKDDGVTVASLAQTATNAWGETNFEELRQGKAGFNQDEDLPGPISVSVVGTVKGVREKEKAGDKDEGEGEKKESDEKQAVPEGRFIVFGDSDFVSNSYVNVQGNGDLFFSAISWLADEGDLVSIRPKETKSDPLILSPLQGRIVFWLPVVVLPLIILITGVLVIIRRRGR
ncbi:MAG: GldG family protein [Deltaproteobacteria bacterium]|nr:GldG family protein [Deltaproteobacteria bacterium]MBW2052065.1 GldG family protein [Deltaproteobacteria bacterium]MBW2141562.1 GldG family protein [Deltaproteobacteria bacterium]MBW2324252.1 GldG family protein [Deltaproteobacteria bacterium]